MRLTKTFRHNLPAVLFRRARDGQTVVWSQILITGNYPRASSFACYVGKKGCTDKGTFVSRTSATEERMSTAKFI